MAKIGCLFTLLLLGVHVSGHGQLTAPTPRVGPTTGEVEAYDQREPVFTMSGPRSGYSSTALRCHDQTSQSPRTTLTAGEDFTLGFSMEAGHPGDCYVSVSYDGEETWGKIFSLLNCGMASGDIPTASISLTFPDIPAGDATLQWLWTAHQQVSDIEFYVQCTDITIVNSNNPPFSPTYTHSAATSSPPSFLPQSASDYRQVYNGQYDVSYLVGPDCIDYTNLDLPANSGVVSQTTQCPQTTTTGAPPSNPGDDDGNPGDDDGNPGDDDGANAGSMLSAVTANLALVASLLLF